MNSKNFLKECYIGIDNLDRQHCKLFRTFDKLMLIKDTHDIHEILMLYNSLVRYTYIHFTDEENFMKTIGYSYIETHKIEHDFFIAQLEKIYFEIEMEDTESIFQILDFLRK
jgi:hemerythrin